MTRLILTLLFLNIAKIKSDMVLSQKGLINVLENKLNHKLTEYATNISKWLENVNDKHLNNTELGRSLGYSEMKYRFQTMESGRGMKKMSMAMLPIIFQVGAASTWMLLTALLAAKSVAIGVILLVFKIAVSTAKVASFFTAWKSKPHQHVHPWSPHYDHHDTHSNTFNPNLWELSGYKSMPNSYIPAESEDYHELHTKHS